MIDYGFAEFLQDAFDSRIRVEEIMWGGVLVDGIPPLDQPGRLTAEAAGYLEDGEPVLDCL